MSDKQYKWQYVKAVGQFSKGTTRLLHLWNIWGHDGLNSLLGKPRRKGPAAKYRMKWKNNIVLDLGKAGFKENRRINWQRIVLIGGFCSECHQCITFILKKTNKYILVLMKLILLCSDHRHVSASHVAIFRWQVQEYKYIYTVQETNIFVLLELAPWRWPHERPKRVGGC